MWQHRERYGIHDIWERRGAEGRWEYAISTPRGEVGSPQWACAVEPVAAVVFGGIEEAREACVCLRAQEAACSE